MSADFPRSEQRKWTKAGRSENQILYFSFVIQLALLFVLHGCQLSDNSGELIKTEPSDKSVPHPLQRKHCQWLQYPRPVSSIPDKKNIKSINLMNLHKYILKLDLAYQKLKEAMDQLICSEGIGTPSFGTLNKIEEKNTIQIAVVDQLTLCSALVELMLKN